MATLACLLSTHALALSDQPGPAPTQQVSPLVQPASSPLLRQPSLNPLQPPDVAGTTAAFRVIEDFVQGRGDLATLAEGTAPGVPPAHGCSVVLRLAGDVIGRGHVIRLPGSQPDTACIAEAAHAAWRDAALRLPDSVTNVPSMDAKGAALAQEVRRQVMISLELAGPMIELRAPTYSDIDARLQPGIDGLAAAVDGKVGVVFPGSAASGSVSPGDAARRAVALAASAARGDIGGGSIVSLTEPVDLEKKHGISLYRFRSTHLAQNRAESPPTMLIRAQRIVDQLDIDEVAELWHTADRLAANLINRTAASPPSGSIPLLTVEHTECRAFDLSLARGALLHYSQSVLRTGREHLQRDPDTLSLSQQANRAAELYLAALRQRIATTASSDRLAASAMLVRYPDTDVRPQEQELRAQVTPDSIRSDIPPGVRGITVWALALIDSPLRVSQVHPGDTRRHATDRPIRALFASTPIASLPTEMPFLGWAELEIDRDMNRSAGRASAPALREMRTLIWKHQVQGVDAGPDNQDLTGGILVPGSRSPIPTWQTARLVTFLATMLAEPELTSPQERPREIVRLLSTARFLRQLQVDDSLEWMCKDPAVVKGGLRNSTVDQRTQTDATAMALFAILEIIESIEKSSRPLPQIPPANP